VYTRLAFSGVQNIPWAIRQDSYTFPFMLLLSKGSLEDKTGG
jgi:hypothetical protein